MIDIILKGILIFVMAWTSLSVLLIALIPVAEWLDNWRWEREMSKM